MSVHQPNHQRRSGTAAVELAICLPFLLVIVMGIWEIGRMVTVQQLIANAAREGGRQASAGQASNASVRQYVVNYLNMNGLTGVNLSMVTMANLTASARSEPPTANQLDQFRVTVTVPYSTIRWSTLAQITSTTTITAAADWYSTKDLPVIVPNVIPTN